MPLSQVVEVTQTRDALQHQVLGGLAVPMLFVRVGWQAVSRSRLGPTHRRPLALYSGDQPDPGRRPRGRRGRRQDSLAVAARPATTLADHGVTHATAWGLLVIVLGRPGRGNCTGLAPGPGSRHDPRPRLAAGDGLLATVLVAGLGWAAASLPAVLGR